MSTMNQPEVMVTVTPAASTEVKKFMEQENVDPAKGGLRVSVQPGGCSGFKYGLLIEDESAEDDLVLERVLRPALFLAGGGWSRTQGRIHVVLLAAAIPRCGHLGPNPPNSVVPSEKSLSRCGHRLVPLRITQATLRGLAHVWDAILRRTADFPR